MKRKTKKALKELREQGEIVVTGKGINELYLPTGVRTGMLDKNKIKKEINYNLPKSFNVKLNGKEI